MTQTTIEWLQESLQLVLTTEQKMQTFGLFQQAIQMEKVQIINAHNHGFTEGTCFGASPISYTFITSEQYYNETFKTEEK